MLTVSRKGFYLLVVAFVMVFFLSGRIAKADGISDINHDESKWSDSGENGDQNSDTNHDQSDWGENGDSDKTWTSNVDSDNGEGGDGEHDFDVVSGDPAGNSVPEPSSLALLTIGMLGVMSLARRSGVRQLA